MSSEVRIHLGEGLTEAVMALVPKDANEALLLDEPDLDYSLWKVVDLPCFAASLNISEASLDPTAPFEWRPASVIYLSRCVCDDVHHGGVQETYLVAGGIWYGVKGIRLEDGDVVFTLFADAEVRI